MKGGGWLFMAGNRISMWRYRGKKRAAIMAALSLYLIGGTGAVSAEDVNVNKRGQKATGITLTDDADKTYNEDLNVNVNVRGSSSGAKFDLYLSNGAQWQNKWIGAERVAVSDRPADQGSPKSYLYRGSKVRNLVGGATRNIAGTSFQQESKPITVDNYSGRQRVIYERNAKGIFESGDFVVKHAAPNAGIILCTDSTGLNTGSADVADRLKVSDTLHSFAQKLHYVAYRSGERNLTGQVEIAEGLTAPAAALKVGEISYTPDGRGSYVSTEKLPLPTTEKKIEKHNSGYNIGMKLTSNKKEIWNDNVVMNVSGSGGGSAHKNVTGFYLLDGGELTINGNLKLRLANAAPATCGTSPGADVAHYYMSGVYAGYGGISSDGDNDNTRFTLHGDLDMDVVGVGLQANKDGYITVNGGTIKTYALTTSDTYALLAEEGSVFMNTGKLGQERGMRRVNITGNLGVIHKNYGIDPNPDKHGSFISLSLPTADSVLTGGILNEYEESGANKYDSGVDLYLSGGAQWNNRWHGAHRAKAVIPRENAASYLYKGSKVRNLFGGATYRQQGNIFQQEDTPITVNSYRGYERVIYGRKADGSIAGGDFIVKQAAPGAFITLCTDCSGLDTSSEDAAEKAKVNETLNALAGKLRYQGYAQGERNLRVIVEIAEGLTAASASLRYGEISYKADGQGEFTGASKHSP